MKLLDIKIRCLIEMINSLQEELIILGVDYDKKYESMVRASFTSLEQLWVSICDCVRFYFDDLNLRDIGDELRLLSNASLNLCKDAELVSLIIVNVKEWFESFPTNDSSRRDLARAQQDFSR